MINEERLKEIREFIEHVEILNPEWKKVGFKQPDEYTYLRVLLDEVDKLRKLADAVGLWLDGAVATGLLDETYKAWKEE